MSSNDNTCAELGTTWRVAMRDPDSAPHYRQTGQAHRGTQLVPRLGLHLVRLAVGPDPSVPRPPDIAGTPGSLRLCADDAQSVGAAPWAQRRGPMASRWTRCCGMPETTVSGAGAPRTARIPTRTLRPSVPGPGANVSPAWPSGRSPGPAVRATGTIRECPRPSRVPCRVFPPTPPSPAPPAPPPWRGRRPLWLPWRSHCGGPVCAGCECSRRSA